MGFFFMTKGKYFNYILSRIDILKCILLLPIDTWPMSMHDNICNTDNAFLAMPLMLGLWGDQLAANA